MMIQIILLNFSIATVAFCVLWVLGTWLRNVSIVDIAWGPACALPAVTTWYLHPVTDPRATIITLLVICWAIRLCAHLAIRNIGHGEDYRYARMREKVGASFTFSSIYRVFALQLVMSFLISLPVQVGQFGSSAAFGTGSGQIGVLAYFGIAVFGMGIVFETVGDAQLQAFKANPENQGKLMDRGLWSWTRHPNYFGDFAVWVGLSLIALESAYGVFTLFSPAIMFYVLYRFAGKAVLERSMVRRYPDYESYKQRVSGFFPRPPRAISRKPDN
ncbi:MAG: DUF1295 domain-containing protein [Henriciella sp.]